MTRDEAISQGAKGEFQILHDQEMATFAYVMECDEERRLPMMIRSKSSGEYQPAQPGLLPPPVLRGKLVVSTDTELLVLPPDLLGVHTKFLVVPFAGDEPETFRGFFTDFPHLDGSLYSFTMCVSD